MKREKYLVRRGLMLQGILIIVSLIFLLSMSGWWAFAFSVAFIAGVCIYALNEGAYLGDKAVAMQKLIDKQQAEGAKLRRSAITRCSIGAWACGRISIRCCRSWCSRL